MSESEIDYDLEAMLGDEEVEQEEVEAVEAEPEKTEEKEPEEKPEPSGDNTYVDFDKISDEETRKIVQARINKDYREKQKIQRELEQEREESRKRMQELEKELSEFKKPKEVKPPTYDDFLDDPDKAAARQQAYAESLAAQREWEWQNKQKEEQLKAELAQQQQRKTKELLDKVQNAGIDEHEFRYSAGVLNQAIPSEEVKTYLCDHEFAAQLIPYLAKNPTEAYEIANLSPFQVGEKLNKIAAKFKPNRKSSAPPPDEPIRSSSAAKEEDPWLKGAQFE